MPLGSDTSASTSSSARGVVLVDRKDLLWNRDDDDNSCSSSISTNSSNSGRWEGDPVEDDDDEERVESPRATTLWTSAAEDEACVEPSLEPYVPPLVHCRSLGVGDWSPCSVVCVVAMAMTCLPGIEALVSTQATLVGTPFFPNAVVSSASESVRTWWLQQSFPWQNRSMEEATTPVAAFSWDWATVVWHDVSPANLRDYWQQHTAWWHVAHTLIRAWCILAVLLATIVVLVSIYRHVTTRVWIRAQSALVVEENEEEIVPGDMTSRALIDAPQLEEVQEKPQETVSWSWWKPRTPPCLEDNSAEVADMLAVNSSKELPIAACTLELEETHDKLQETKTGFSSWNFWKQRPTPSVEASTEAPNTAGKSSEEPPVVASAPELVEEQEKLQDAKSGSSSWSWWKQRRAPPALDFPVDSTANSSKEPAAAVCTPDLKEAPQKLQDTKKAPLSSWSWFRTPTSRDGSAAEVPDIAAANSSEELAAVADDDAHDDAATMVSNLTMDSKNVFGWPKLFSSPRRITAPVSPTLPPVEDTIGDEEDDDDEEDEHVDGLKYLGRRWGRSRAPRNISVPSKATGRIAQHDDDEDEIATYHSNLEDDHRSIKSHWSVMAGSATLVAAAAAATAAVVVAGRRR
jgi:hypothetical protein